MIYLDTIALAIYRESENEPTKEPEAWEWPLYRMYAVLALATGEATTAANVHDAWVAWRTESNPQHADLVPFDQLGIDVQSYDDPYVNAIHKSAKGSL